MSKLFPCAIFPSQSLRLLGEYSTNVRKLWVKFSALRRGWLINKINLLEVYYDVIKAYNDQEADKMLEIVKKMPIKIIVELKDEVFKKAGQLKSKYKISIADSIAIAESIINNGALITADHHEIEPVEIAEKINITWFR
jgi:predicted nucleic acid-binding protein